MNKSEQDIKKSQLYIALGMGIGLILTGSMSTYHLQQNNLNMNMLQYQRIIVIKGKRRPVLTTFHATSNPCELDRDVQILLSEFTNTPVFIEKIKEYVGILYKKAICFDQYSSMEPWMDKVQLVSVASKSVHHNQHNLFFLQGSDRLVIKLRIILVNGKQLERVVLAEAERFKKEINLIGFLPVSQILSTSNGLYMVRSVKTMEATAYYPGSECTGIFCDGLTSTGEKAGYGMVAVDPEIIPLGTKLYIQGYGFAEAADVGAAIKGERIDLCFNTYREAVHFGRKRVKVYIFK